MDKKLRLIYASSWAATCAVAFATVITVWAELQAPLKNWLKSISGHHWTTKSWFTVGIYVVVLLLIYGFKRNPSDQQVRSGLKRLVVVAIAGALILFLFFAWHYLAA